MVNLTDQYILIPTDFSEVCENAINHAIKIATSSQSKLLLLHLLDKTSKSKLKKEHLDIEYIENKLVEKCNNIKEKHSIRVEYEIAEGKTSDIPQYVYKYNAVLMVLGTHGKKGLQYLWGSHALKIVLNSIAPTLIVQDDSMPKEFKRILFPVSNFTEPRQKVNITIALSNIFKSTIYIFKQEQKYIDTEHKIKIITDQIENEFHRFKIPIHTFQSYSNKNFDSEILKFTDEIDPDLLVIVTNSDIYSPSFNHTAWDEKMMFNSTKTPVLMVNPVITGSIDYIYNGLF
ncbi:MAG: universal stress protein [Hyphomicrobiales bacterium]